MAQPTKVFVDTNQSVACFLFEKEKVIEIVLLKQFRTPTSLIKSLEFKCKSGSQARKRSLIFIYYHAFFFICYPKTFRIKSALISIKSLKPRNIF